MITCFFHETGYLIQGVFLREKKSFSHRFFWLTATLVMIWPHSCIGTCIWSIFKITPTRIDVMFALVFLRSSVTVYNLHLRILTYTDQGLSMYSCCIQSIASPFQRLPCKQMLLCKKRARLAHSKKYYQNLLKLSLKESFFFFAVRHDANNQGILYLWLLEIGKKSRTPPRPHSAEMAKP